MKNIKINFYQEKTLNIVIYQVYFIVKTLTFQELKILKNGIKKDKKLFM